VVGWLNREKSHKGKPHYKASSALFLTQWASDGSSDCVAMGTAIRVATDRKRENNDVYHSELREKGVCGKELNNAVDRGEEPVATVARR